MEEGSGGGGGGASSSSSTLLSGGGRQRFEVELRPGETTIVSWKKLVKDANKAASNNKAPPVPDPPVPPPVAANHALDSRNALPSRDYVENDANDAPHGSRFGAVIEKIERLYMGKNSSDEEDLNDVPEDDEYDTGDSFIDDTELDEYFQVDNSAIKHDGFFVNRGKLERTTVTENESIALPSQQPKKRRRKDAAKGYGGRDDGHVPNKHMKVNNNTSGKVVSPVDKNVGIPSQSKAPSTEHCEDIRLQNPIIALGTIVKKSSDRKSLVDPSLTRIPNGEVIMTAKNIDRQKAGVLQPKDHGNQLKDGSPSSVVPLQRSNDKSSHVQSKSQSGLLLNNSEELNQSLLMREKDMFREQSETKAAEITQQTMKNPLGVKKEGSCAKPKSAMLEKAIKDLEKIVVESRPPSTEVPPADNSSQAVKRRMPPEIKHKLAKVARLAHAIHGKISKELLNRLMSIVGHLIQLRSLKRNLKDMVNMGLFAKKERDARLQQLKKQIDDMVKIRAPMMKSKAMEQQAGESDDFQETGTKEKEVLKRSFTMDDTLEDKICDLYDLFVEGLDEDAGPQVRKLYAELAEMWPQGFMDNHGIRRAICRAKDRRKTVHRHKDEEKLSRKKIVGPKTESVEIGDNCSSGGVRSISSALAGAQLANSCVNNNPNNMEKPKQEKVNGGEKVE